MTHVRQVLWEDDRPTRGVSRESQAAAFTTQIGRLVVRIGLDTNHHENDWVLEAGPFFAPKRQLTIVGHKGDKLEVVQDTAISLVREQLLISLSQL